MQFTLVVLVHSKKPPDRKGTVNVSVSGSISVVVVGRVVDIGTFEYVLAYASCSQQQIEYRLLLV